MMKLTDKIWFENDAEKRGYLWAYFIQQADLSIKTLQLSPKYAEVKQRKTEYQNLLEFAKQFDSRNNQIAGINQLEKQLFFSNPLASDDIKQRVKEIQTSYLPQLEKRIEAFTDLKHFLYDIVKIEPVGILNSYNKEGFLFLRNSESCFVKTYSYFISNYVNANERTLVKLCPVDEFKYSINYGYNQHKKSLNRNRTYYLNCYALESEMDLPLDYSFLPIAKGKLSKFLAIS